VLHFQLPNCDYALTVNIYYTEGVLIKMAINNQIIGSDGFVIWEGVNYIQQKVPMGIYFILV
jgi:hypothetical protein